MKGFKMKKKLYLEIRISPAFISNKENGYAIIKYERSTDELNLKFEAITERGTFFTVDIDDDGIRDINRNTSKLHMSIEMHGSWELASCLKNELRKSRKFRKGFVQWIIKKGLKNVKSLDTSGQGKDFLEDHQCKCMELRFKRQFKDERNGLGNLKTQIYSFDIDFFTLVPSVVNNLQAELKWSYLLVPLVIQRFYLEYILACLSTLGGAYSSLGEHSRIHAGIAGKISLQQLAVASKLGNPILASHCRLYHAHSLIQTGKFKAAAFIIRNEYTIANSSLGKSEPKLLICCKAAWERLRYLRKKAPARKDEQTH